MKLHRRTALQLASLAWVSSFAPGLYAQANTSPLRLLVGYSPGGATDVIARLLGVHMRAASAAMATVENVPGASGRLALLALKRSKPTDHMAVLTPDFPLTLFPHLYRKLGYEPMADFVPVTTCGVSISRSALDRVYRPRSPRSPTTSAGARRIPLRRCTPHRHRALRPTSPA